MAAVFSKRDLEKMFNLRRMRQPMNLIQVDKNIVGRYYQEEAIKDEAPEEGEELGEDKPIENN